MATGILRIQAFAARQSSPVEGVTVTVTGDGFELMFGDCGRVYFCIRKEDLAARRFDRVWLILQCG